MAKSEGHCYLCEKTLGKTAMKNHIIKEHLAQDGEPCTLLKVEGTHNKNYWLFLDISDSRTLNDLDNFLREIWMECCGHLSQFSQNSKTKFKNLGIGNKISYEYDFGSSTDCVITVIAKNNRPRQKKPVRLLARNAPFVFTCGDCNEPAKHVCGECLWTNPNAYFCDKCAENHEHYGILPITNSPRNGECGYDGGMDKYTFSPGISKEKSNVLIFTPKKQANIDPREICEGNADFESILRKFEKKYIKGYNNRKVAERTVIAENFPLNYTLWCYSSPHELMGVSPMRFINSQVCHYGDYVVYPRVAAKYRAAKMKQMDFSYIYYSIENHPFINDMKAFTGFLNRNANHKSKSKIRDILDYIDTLPEDVLDLITFPEKNYLSIVTLVCGMLSLYDTTKDGRGVETFPDAANALFALSNKEILLKVTDVLVERFVSLLEVFAGDEDDERPTKDDVMSALTTSLTVGDFIEQIKGTDILDNILNAINDIEADEVPDPESVFENIGKTQAYVLVCHTHFFNTFGRALQLIIPESDVSFDFTKTDDMYLGAIHGGDIYDEDDVFSAKATVYSRLHDAYNITPIGAKLFDLNFSETEQELPWVHSDDYNEILDEMLDDYEDDGDDDGLDMEGIAGHFGAMLEKMLENQKK